MTPAELRAYYDIPENAAAMCDLLMGAHSGWEVWRRRADRMFDVPVWCARRKSWPPDQMALVNENAGLLNQAMTMVSTGAVVA